MAAIRLGELRKTNMGANASSIKAPLPDTEGPIIFDPMKGFPEGRKERVMHVTEDEMASAMIPQTHRDYCAHKLIDLHSCYQKNFPMNWRCHHERHVYQTCTYEDSILRFKEYERERRLLERQAKKEARAKRLAQQEG
ncbi:NADH:ubiquinone oxidoreductase B18 subunit [Trinorchestia longiramus]|nr:NADH:ubiquinone oxidoreductase B18 subunit [Trinorchestia longiramus]